MTGFLCIAALPVLAGLILRYPGIAVLVGMSVLAGFLAPEFWVTGVALGWIVVLML